MRRAVDESGHKSVRHRPKRHFVVLTTAGALLLVILACGRGGRPTPAAAGLPAGATTHSLAHDERERSYIRYVPSSVDWDRPVPIVFVFHGGTGNAASAERMSQFDTVADAHGFVVIYPDGSGRFGDDRLLTWNGGDCCGYAAEQNVDDVGFVRAIVADLQTGLTVDEKRIYAAGLSNGATLTHRLACEAADLLAAIAPVAGTLTLAPCEPAQPVAVVEFHGTADRQIPFDGGIGPDSLVDVDYPAVADTVAFWVSANNCAVQPETNSFADIVHDTWSGCAGHAAVELYTIVDGGHAWPGGQPGRANSDQPTTSIDASDLIWAFFAAHPKA